MKIKKGVTLTELLIVLSIISFLAFIVSFSTRNQIFKGNDARRKADLKRISLAVEEYEKDNNCYPLPSLLTCDPGQGLNPYLDKIPCDPGTDTTYFYEHEDSECPKWYRIYAVLENENDPDFEENIGPLGSYNYSYESPNAQNVSGAEEEDEEYYGCLSGVCVPITWDEERPGPECDPNYQNITCYNECGNPSNECQNWK